MPESHRRAPVVVLGDVAVVTESRHQLSPRPSDALYASAGTAGFARVAEAGQGGAHHVECLRGIAAVAYVDLNPIRAKLATSIDASDFTSGQARYAQLKSPDSVSSPLIKPRLVPFIEAEHLPALDHLPFNLNDYLDLIDTTGRLVVNGKRGFIPGQQPRLLDTLKVDPQQWLATAIQLHARYELALGTPAQLTQLAKRWGKRWLQGIRQARRLYPVPSG